MDNLETLDGCLSILGLSQNATPDEIIQARDQKIQELKGLRKNGPNEENTDPILKEYTEIRAAAQLLTTYREKFGDDGRLKESDGDIRHLVDTVTADEIRALNKPTEYQKEQFFGVDKR